MKSAAAIVLLGCALVVLAGCGSTEESQDCPEGADDWVEYQLFFGLSRPDGGSVSEEEWRAFLADTVTPRFPDGLTALAGSGQWRTSSGEIQREGSRLLIIYAPPGDEGRQSIDEISEIYEQRFDQQSVLRVIGSACVSFS